MNVLFVCVENAGRSQLAEHMFNASVIDTDHAARSCGTRPRDAVYPEVVAALGRRGIDASTAVPKALTEELTGWADRIVTMGCGDECPATGKPTEDWELADVKGAGPAEVEEIAIEIAKRLSKLLAELGVPAWA